MQLDALVDRACPGCGSHEPGAVFVQRNIQDTALSQASFASRKRPEFFSWHMQRCPTCSLVYATHIPPTEAVNAAYADASFDTSLEAGYAAQTYAEALLPRLTSSKGAALEIGAGTGAFLPFLIKAGYEPVWGLEPSAAAIAAATPTVKPHIIAGFFPNADVPDGPFSLIACFMTIEHLPDPKAFCAEAFARLAPGGTLAIVCHNERGALNRLLGRKSPIVDIEHFQLFSPSSLSFLLGKSGFTSIQSHALRNRYPLRYWLRLLPLPHAIKDMLEKGVQRLGIDRVPLTIPVGNMLTLARKSNEP